MAWPLGFGPACFWLKSNRGAKDLLIASSLCGSDKHGLSNFPMTCRQSHATLGVLKLWEGVWQPQRQLVLDSCCLHIF